jgi:ferrochelatase
MAEKIAVVLFNLGGPDKPESIRPFLKNFFMDRNIICLPYLARWMISEQISRRRSKREAGDSYGAMGGGSPILKNTQDQAQALEKKLNEKDGATYRVFVCMRYWHPMAKEVIKAVNDYKPNRLVLLPLYPQYSTTTTKSSFENFWKDVQANDGWLHKEWNDGVKVSSICCWAEEEGFIATSTRLIKETYNRALHESGKKPRVLFSAHGLPEKFVTDGDPYQDQCSKTAQAIVQRLGITDLDWLQCYQSRVGRLKWLEPSTESEIRRAGKDGVSLVIYPHAFVNEHVETLVELDIEYKHIADEVGVPWYGRVPVVATDSKFIDGLAAMVLTAQTKIGCHAQGRKCASSFSCCALKEK